MRKLLLGASLFEVFVLCSPLPQFGNRGTPQMPEKSAPRTGNFMALSQARSQRVTDQSQVMSNTADGDITDASSALAQAVDQAALSAHGSPLGMLIDAEPLFLVVLNIENCKNAKYFCRSCPERQDF
jgi:hypothetical protein